MKRYTLLILTLSVLLASCETDTVCHRDLTAVMQVTLKADSLDIFLNTHTFTNWDTLTVWGVGQTDSIVRRQQNVAKWNAELRPNAMVTAFLMTYRGRTDTLYVYHTPRQEYISLACGCAMYHTILGAYSTDKRVDSVEIVNAAVESTVQENLRLHLHLKRYE